MAHRAVHPRFFIASLLIVLLIIFGHGFSQAQQPNRPEGLTATQVTHDSITVSWNAVPGAPSYLAGIKGHDWQIVYGGATSYTFTGLQPKSNYRIRVKFYDMSTHQYSRSSERLKVKTLRFVPAKIDIRATLVDSAIMPGRKAYTFDIDPVPGAASYHLGNGIFQSPAQLGTVELILGPGESRSVKISAHDAAGKVIAHGRQRVKFPKK